MRRWAVLAVAVLVGCGEPEVVAPAEAADMAPPAARKYQARITREARLVWGLDAPIPALAAQLHAESGWQEDARSGVGATGLAQFMPGTAAEMARLYPELAPAAPLNADWAIRAQSRLMKSLFDRTKNAADECNRYAFAAASYNAGPGSIDRDRAFAERTGRDRNRWWGHTEERSTRPDWAWRETKGYVKSILLYLQPRYYAAWGRMVCAEKLA